MKSIPIGYSVKAEQLNLALANRHGLITGATGTGKTVTLQILAEGFSKAGVPVFASDIKGDLSGLAESGVWTESLINRAEQVKLNNYITEAYPVIFWDLFGKEGHPIRTTIADMGPLLLSRLMGLSEAQEGALNIAFRLAEDEGLLLLDLKDLRALLSNLAERGKFVRSEYGTVNATTIGTIQRRLLVLDMQGANNFFGEPALDITDMMLTTPDGRGYINILSADRLMESPQLYATFLLWMLTKLYSTLPEVGDPDKPKFVFFFDEAHLLFADITPALMQKVEQVVRLIRSKGVGVYFVTQNPMDVPDTVLAQLGNRVQHALRVFTPREQRAVKVASQTFRQNPRIDTERAIGQLSKGEALVSVLDAKGTPTMVERTVIRPPSSKMGPCSQGTREDAIALSPIYGDYEVTIDRPSAYEKLKARTNPSYATPTVSNNFLAAIAKLVGWQIGEKMKL